MSKHVGKSLGVFDLNGITFNDENKVEATIVTLGDEQVAKIGENYYALKRTKLTLNNNDKFIIDNQGIILEYFEAKKEKKPRSKGCGCMSSSMFNNRY